MIGWPATEQNNGKIELDPISTEERLRQNGDDTATEERQRNGGNRALNCHHLQQLISSIK